MCHVVCVSCDQHGEGSGAKRTIYTGTPDVFPQHALLLPFPLSLSSSSALLIVAWQRVTCADVLYSGHTVNLTICALIWDEYSHEKDALIIDTDTEWDLFETCCRNRPLVNRAGYLMRPTFMKVFMWVFCLVGFIVIIATKFHYTVDVFLGAVITIFVWKFYHSHIRNMWDAQVRGGVGGDFEN